MKEALQGRRTAGIPGGMDGEQKVELGPGTCAGSKSCSPGSVEQAQAALVCSPCPEVPQSGVDSLELLLCNLGSGENVFPCTAIVQQ